MGVPSLRLKKVERFILEHGCIYSWKRHALCYAVLGYVETVDLLRYKDWFGERNMLDLRR